MRYLQASQSTKVMPEQKSVGARYPVFRIVSVD